MNNNAELNTPQIEKTKRFLKRYRKNQELIFRLKNKLANLNDRLIGLKASTISDMPKGSQPVPMEDILSEKIETEERIDRLKQKGAVIRAEIIEKIDELDRLREVEILEAFCIDCKDFDEIAEDIGYSTRRVIEIYSEAIRHVEL